MGNKQTLPTGYTLLEYLESTGAQYSDPYIITDACAGEETEVVFSSPYFDETNRIYGIGVDSYSYFVGLQSTSSLFIRVKNAEQTFIYQPAAAYDTTHAVYIGRDNVTLNGQTVSHAAYEMLEFHPDLHLTLFGQGTCDANYNVIGTGYGRPGTRIYSFRNWQAGTLRGEYVPALDSAGTPCMFDKVSCKTFYNAGAGKFIAGVGTLEQARALRLPAGGGELTLSLPQNASTDHYAQAALERARAQGWTLLVQYREELEVPVGYKRLEHLESTGAITTQYIITDVCIGDESEVTFSAPYYNDTNRILGGGITNETYSYLVGIDYGGWTFIRLRNYEQTFIYQANAGHDIKNVVYIGQNEVKLNGNVISAANYQMPAFPSGVRVGLFREVYWDANGGIVPGGAGLRVSRIYGFKGWRGGILLGNYLPALDPSGRPCMYDTVSGTTFYNAGTGQFTAGLTTVEDVRTLHLPNEGGSLTLSVPSTTTEADLTVMHANNPNWTLTIQIRDYE